MKINFLIITICVIIIVGFTIGTYIILNDKPNSAILKNNNSSLDHFTVTPTPTDAIIDYNTTLDMPPNDFVINHINWSEYTNLEQGYVYLDRIEGPTDTIPHKFIEIQILTEVKNTSNSSLIRSELSGVAFEVRNIYGPNSDIHILGTKDGAATWDITLYPYESNAH